jgi:hypothetical protein
MSKFRDVEARGLEANADSQRAGDWLDRIAEMPMLAVSKPCDLSSKNSSLSHEFMTYKFLSSLGGAALLAAVISLTTNLRAATPAQTPTAVASEGSDLPLLRVQSSEVATLRQAYGILAVADHDYKGHRVKAMKAIEAACKLLGTDISGDGKGKEKQAISDDQLKQVLSTVQQVAASIGPTQPKVAAHLNVAVQQLTTALSIK